jgi:hypothetical protein
MQPHDSLPTRFAAVATIWSIIRWLIASLVDA